MDGFTGLRPRRLKKTDRKGISGMVKYIVNGGIPQIKEEFLWVWPC